MPLTVTRALLALVLAASTVAASPPLVGVLSLLGPVPEFPLRDGLTDLGHEVGRTVLLERLFASGDNARFPALARELLGRKPAIVVSPCGPALRAIRDINRTIPVVAVCSDAKNFLGEVASLRRPGGATTGATFLAPESATKRLEILKEIHPELRRVAFLYHSGDDWTNYWLEIERVAPRLGLAVLRLPIKGAEDLDGALATSLRQRADSLIAFPDATTIAAAGRIASFALRHRLATAFDLALFADAGGLLSYGANPYLMVQRVSARQVDMILRGAKPGDMPVEQPTEFELVINLRTARALGFTISPAVLLLANRVIE